VSRTVEEIRASVAYLGVHRDLPGIFEREDAAVLLAALDAANERNAVTHACWVADRSRAEAAEDGLRELASYVGAGGYNAPAVDAAEFVAKVRWGIDNQADEISAHVRTLQAEVERLNALINTPHVDDFVEAIRVEAAHQQERWKSDHDAGKSDADWFWLLGYLAGKALRPGALEKKLHHVITTAAVCLNWHAHLSGARTGMRPGIEPPKETL
jgi:outer membrane murein-binding lipoprotein Lpp